MFDHAKLIDFAPGRGLAAGAASLEYDDGTWLDIPVPGDVHVALMAAGRIPDPYVDQNETACAWMEEREWWYRLRLPPLNRPLAGDERLLLVFHGLDTFATVYLDGEELGRHQNMFRPAVFDITHRLQDGRTSVIAVRFDPPLDRIAGKIPHDLPRTENRVAMRKAQFGYGWDWGPRLPTIGIWRPVELRRQRRAALTGVHFSTVDLSPDQSRAVVAVRLEVERFATDRPLTAHIHLFAGNDPPIEHEVVLAGSVHADTACLVIDQPRLWWTHDLGQPTLYDLRVTLVEDGDALDRWQAPVGIRTLALDQSPDPAERGTRFFRFVLNGAPIFARGANWIPADSFVGTLPATRYERLVAQAHDANMNMLRVWGGGIYEHDAFYDACDRWGILVWQDFMFACAAYPEDDPDFAREVDEEARFQVRRLRSHPCLALWCGNNENQWIIESQLWDTPQTELPPYGRLYYDRILPAAVAALDGRTPYWPSSPYGGNDHNSMEEGDRHNWDAWHGGFPRRFGEPPHQEFTPEGVTYLRYAEDTGRFISEFGLHAAPGLETLRRVIPDDQLYHHSAALDWHNKDNPKNKGDMLLQSTTGLPADLTEYIDLSQLAQAEGLKFGIEHFRRRWPHCAGALVWQLNDCWPCLSWSVIDYYGFSKASYFYLRRAFAPLLASFAATPDGSVALWLTNNSLADVADTAILRLSRFDGAPAWEIEQPIAAPAGTSLPVWRWTGDDGNARRERYLSVRSMGGAFGPNRHFFAPIKDLRRPPATVETRMEQAGPHELLVELEAKPTGYALFVHLTTPSEETGFNDNFFDLAPGERRTIRVSNPQVELTPEVIAVSWR